MVKHILKLVPEEFVNRELSTMWNMYFESDCIYMVAGAIKIILELTKIVIHIRGCWAFFLPFSPVPLLFFFPHPYFPISPLISSLHLSFPSHVPTGQGYCHLSPPRSSRKRIVIYSFNRLFSVSSVLTVLTLPPRPYLFTPLDRYVFVFPQGHWI